MRQMEYTQDRLRKEIRDLEIELEKLKARHARERDSAIVAETIICIVMFFLGYVIGRWA